MSVSLMRPISYVKQSKPLLQPYLEKEKEKERGGKKKEGKIRESMCEKKYKNNDER